MGSGDGAKISLAKSGNFAGQHLPREIFAPPRLAAPESSRIGGGGGGEGGRASVSSEHCMGLFFFPKSPRAFILTVNKRGPSSSLAVKYLDLNASLVAHRLSLLLLRE